MAICNSKPVYSIYNNNNEARLDFGVPETLTLMKRSATSMLVMPAM